MWDVTLTKAVILAGGYGTRLMEETDARPKPMVEIGGKPIIWHIMKIYSAHGINDFIICLGYKGYMLKEYFSNYYLHMTDVTFDMSNNTSTMLEGKADKWKVTLVDTGQDTMTGGRLKRITPHLDDEAFCMTYGDAVSTVDISKTIAFHRSHRKLATVTAVRPPSRFGALDIHDATVRGFREKPLGENQWINGGFFVLSPKALETIEDDHTVWENAPMETLARAGQLKAYEHDGFWQPMDTLRDKRMLEALWNKGQAPWKIF
jgi:glucose-1-phosphate cytidylyltransferase